MADRTRDRSPQDANADADRNEQVAGNAAPPDLGDPAGEAIERATAALGSDEEGDGDQNG